MSFKMPNMEHRFHVQIVGEETGMTFQGDFLYRRPTNNEKILIETMRVRLNSDLTTLSDDVFMFNMASSFLSITLREFPDWWKDSDLGGRLFDRNVVMEVYEEVKKFEEEFRKRITSGNPKDVKDPVGKDHP